MADTEYYRAEHQYDIAPDEPYSSAIVDAVADVKDGHPAELPEVLYDAVDTDALDMMFSGPGEAPGNEMSLSFVYCDYLVTVSADRTLQIKQRSGN